MKRIFLLLLFILGFLLMPGTGMACTIKSLKSPSHKEMSAKNVKEHSCCKSSDSKNKNHNCDGGKCTHTKCACSFSCSVFLFFTPTVTSNTVIEIASAAQRFPDLETLVSTGYRSLWLIPKIG
ncbi:hypothetical protein [Flavobacterium flavigenum]|uniref:hypothetical protein n=1 Tax=Flavobacterium flavigenum TaxID=3003258 RepID=UPI0022AC8035|nr:hypothetical protein [Flavobacterium flavigenum]